MSETYAKLVITPRIIDLGSKVVQLRQVASVGYTMVYPHRGLGLFLLIAAALALMIAGISASPPFGNSSGNLMAFLVALVLGVCGLVAFNFTSRFVTIATADGDKLRLASADREFLMNVLARIREAMEAKPEAGLHTVVNITAGTIETNSLVDLSQTEVAGSPGAFVTGRDVVLDGQAAKLPAGTARTEPSLPANGMGRDAAAGSMLATPGEGARNGYANGGYRPQASYGQGGGAAAGHDLRFEQRGGAMRAAVAEAAATVAGRPAAGNQLSVAHSPGAVAIGGSAAGAHIATRVEASPLTDVEALVGMITRSGHPHQEALVGLLRVVEQHLKGGRVTREDAVSHWRSFAEYATQYLTGIDGLIAITERLQRLLGR